MPPSKKICPECGDELWAMHLPAHMAREHGIEPEPKVAKSPSGGAPAASDTTAGAPRSADEPEVAPGAPA